jgi:hypothetical protein
MGVLLYRGLRTYEVIESNVLDYVSILLNFLKL